MIKNPAIIADDIKKMATYSMMTTVGFRGTGKRASRYPASSEPACNRSVTAFVWRCVLTESSVRNSVSHCWLSSSPSAKSC